MKKIKALGLAIWLISLFLINVSAVSATTNCKVDCCDNSNPLLSACNQPSQTCAKDAAYNIAGTLTDCSLSPTDTGGCNASQLPICCCTYPPLPKHEQASKPTLVNSDALTPLQFTPQVSIPNSDFQAGAPTNVGAPVSTASGTIMRSDLLGRYILSIYNYGLAIVGILAAIILMAGGLLWLSSGGSATKIGQAKELMIGSVVGLIILSGAWIILNTINPNLTQLPSIDTLIINEVPYCCDAVKGNVPAVEGICPDSSKGCTNGEVCINSGKVVANSDGHEGASSNEFSCVDTSTKICCGYHVQAGNDDRDICFTFAGDACQAIPDLKPYQANASPAVITAKGSSAVSFARHEDCGNGKLVPHGVTCAAGIVDCSNAQDGDKCPTKDGSVKGWCYCYNKAPWYGSGTLGQPCGNQGSTCFNDGTRCDNHDYNGGRDCGTNMFCCNKAIEK